MDRYDRFNPQQYSQITSVLRKLDSAEVFEILYTFLTNVDRSATIFEDQEFAGRLLLDLQLTCTLKLREAIQGLLKGYNFSIEELFWYFAQQYGKQVVLEILEKLRTELNCEQQQQSIKTWEWWLQACKD